MKATFLSVWLLVLGSYAIARGQTEEPASSSSLDSRPQLSSSVDQWGKHNYPHSSPQSFPILLTAKTVLVVSDPPVLYPTSKASQKLKKELEKWGRFQLVDEVGTADLIMVISAYSSSRRTRMERIKEVLTIFVGGSAIDPGATPLWVVYEAGAAFGQRPAGKLVEDLRKYLAELENSALISAASP